MIKRVFSIKGSQVLLFFRLFFSGLEYRKSLNSDELEKDVYFFNCLRGDEDAERTPAAAVKTVNANPRVGLLGLIPGYILKHCLRNSWKHQENI